jgi:hypothetical protein
MDGKSFQSSVPVIAVLLNAGTLHQAYRSIFAQSRFFRNAYLDSVSTAMTPGMRFPFGAIHQ